tara:strand:+ start:428 stop:613 length:186 start_codon:yes stop_codon:yes gene_type:complete
MKKFIFASKDKKTLAFIDKTFGEPTLFGKYIQKHDVVRPDGKPANQVYFYANISKLKLLKT